MLLYYGGNNAEDDIRQLAPHLKNIDLVVAANQFGEPTYKPQPIPETSAQLVMTGHKGMFVCLIALYDDGSPTQYARIPLTDAFGDSEAMMQSLADYQGFLKTLGFDGLGLKPIPHPSGGKFIGSEKCGECHGGNEYLGANASCMRPSRGSSAEQSRRYCGILIPSASVVT
ncbi:MAG: hypothetical protein R3C05_23180 [Pirellulaceae bacterium]